MARIEYFIKYSPQYNFPWLVFRKGDNIPLGSYRTYQKAKDCYNWYTGQGPDWAAFGAWLP